MNISTRNSCPATGSTDGLTILQRLLVFAAASTTIVLFGLTPATTRMAVAQVDGLTIGVFRTVVAGLFTVPLLLIFRFRPPTQAGDWVLLLLSALGSFAAFPVLFSLGQQMTSAAHACLIMAVMPLFVGLIGMAVDGRMPRFGWFIGAGVAVIGEAALVGMRDHAASAQSSLLGDVIVFTGCIMFAVGVVAGARLSSRISPWAATFWAITVASVFLAPLAVFKSGTLAWSSFTPQTWASLAHVTFGATILANVAWLWALSRGGIVRIAPLQFSQPVIALIFAFLLLREQLDPALLIVAGLILAGIILAYRGARTAFDQKTRSPLSTRSEQERLHSRLPGMLAAPMRV
jgi:drug/metabolite transporter (DMT)-like permease